MFRKALYFIALLALAGCALPRSINSPEKIAQIKSVILISAVEDKLMLNYIGFTVFNNKRYEVPVDWRLNDFFREEMAKSLSGRYEIRPFEYDPKAFSGAADSGDATLGTATETTKRLKQAVPPDLADAIIVVVSDSSASLGARIAQDTVVGAHYTMNVYDGHSLEPIAQSFGGIRCSSSFCLNGYDPMIWPTSFRWSGGEPATSLTPQMRDEIRRLATLMLRDSVPQTLGRLKLLPSDGQ